MSIPHNSTLTKATIPCGRNLTTDTGLDSSSIGHGRLDVAHASLREITVLFARSDSIYKLFPCCDVWDAERDARQWPGGTSVVAHPPCRAWGRLRTFANTQPGEKELAIWAVEQVRTWGGVLEHPYKSTLWDAPEIPLPYPGQLDRFGGWTLAAPQFWFGHAADRATWFYIVGVKPGDCPPIPIVLGEAEFVVQTRKRTDHRRHIPKADRERTPLKAAEWLVEVARRAQIAGAL